MATKPVLVGVDPGEPSYEAVRQGHEWAKRRGARLVLCHVMPPRVGTGMLLRQKLDETIGKSLFEARVVERIQQIATELTGRSPNELDVVIGEGVPCTATDDSAIRHDPFSGADRILVPNRTGYHFPCRRQAPRLATQFEYLAYTERPIGTWRGASAASLSPSCPITYPHQRGSAC